MTSLSTLTGNLRGNVWGRRRPLSTINTWNAPSYSKEWDLTFSYGRETSEYEVLKLLYDSECISDDNIHEYLRGIVVGENLHNGQVIVFCAKPGLSDIFVEKLLNFAGDTIKKCHSYSNTEIPVRFSFIHPSIDIEADIIKRHLQNYGEVKEWSYIRDKKFGVRTGAVVFIMYERDLKVRPLPSKIFINHMYCRISYRTQVKTCFSCGSPSHMKRDCPKINFPTISEANNSESNSVHDRFRTNRNHSNLSIKTPVESNTGHQKGPTIVLDNLGARQQTSNQSQNGFHEDEEEDLPGLEGDPPQTGHSHVKNSATNTGSTVTTSVSTTVATADFSSGTVAATPGNTVTTTATPTSGTATAIVNSGSSTVMSTSGTPVGPDDDGKNKSGDVNDLKTHGKRKSDEMNDGVSVMQQPEKKLTPPDGEEVVKLKINLGSTQEVDDVLADLTLLTEPTDWQNTEQTEPPNGIQEHWTVLTDDNQPPPSGSTEYDSMSSNDDMELCD